MSKYTTEVRFICETEYGLKESVGQAKVDDILTVVAPKIFDFDFPIFDETYRLALEKKILRHFYTREIGCETVGLWKLRLEDKMNEIMPFLNKYYMMYVSELNPLYNVDVTKSGNNNLNRDESKNNYFYNHSDTNSEGNNNSQRLYSDTPQNGLTAVQNGEYLTNATVDGSKSNGEGHADNVGCDTARNNVKDVNEYYETVQGRNSGFIGDAWKKFTEGFRNVDKMLFNELEELFFHLW